MKRYLNILEEKYITRTEQLRGLDNNDWKRLNLPDIIEEALRKEVSSREQHVGIVLVFTPSLHACASSKIRRNVEATLAAVAARH